MGSDLASTLHFVRQTFQIYILNYLPVAALHSKMNEGEDETDNK